MDGAAVVVRFERAFEADYRRVRQHLAQYIGEINQSPDGLSVRFDLLGVYGLKTSALDNLVVVDLVEGAAAPKSEDSQTDSLARLRVRTGVHPGFTRVVFDWTVDVSYTVSREEGRVTVAFGRAATVDLAALNRRPPRWIGSAAARIEGGGLTVEIGVPESARLRDFRSGTKVVVDILGKAEEQPAEEAAVPEPAQEPVPAPEPEPEPQSAPAPEPEPAPELAPAEDSPPPQPAAVAATAEPAPIAQGEPARLLPEDLEPAPGAEPEAEPAAVAQREIAVTFPETEGLLRVAIAWRAPVAAAVFERAGHVWAVFDQPARATVEPIPPELSQTLSLAEQVENSNGTALRFKVRDGLHPSVGLRNGIWEIDFAPQAGVLQTVIGVERESVPGRGPRVFLPVAEAGNPVDIEDPEVGDRLAVVPVHGVGQGVQTARDFVEFAVLPTAQGVLVRSCRGGGGSQRLRARFQSFRSGRSQMSFLGLSYSLSRS